MSKETKETALANQTTETELAEMHGLATEMGGLIQVRATLLKTNHLKLAQSSSKAAKSGLAKHGDFICEEASKNYGATVTIIPLMVKESASLLYTENKPPRIIPEGITPVDGMPMCGSKDLIRNFDGALCKNCPFDEYHMEWRDKQPPKCKQSIDVFCLNVEDNNIMLMQFRKSNYNGGKSLVNLIVRSPNGLPFTCKYTLKGKDETSGKNDYKVVDPKIEKTLLTQEEINAILPAVRKFLLAQKDGQIDYQVHDEADEAEVSNGIPF